MAHQAEESFLVPAERTPQAAPEDEGEEKKMLHRADPGDLSWVGVGHLSSWFGGGDAGAAHASIGCSGSCPQQ